MGNHQSLCDKKDRNNRRGEPSQEEIGLQDSPPARVTQRRTGGTQGSSILPSSLYPPEQQRQTVGQESTPREVAGADFNQYIRVDEVTIPHVVQVNAAHEAGHIFIVEFTVTNTTSDYLKFTSTPTLEWREIEQKREGEIIPTHDDRDMYVEKPEGRTFKFWRLNWDQVIKPNETKKILVEDRPRLININGEKNGIPRTVSRHLDFNVGVPGNGPRVRATQNVEVVNGVTRNIDFQIH